MAFLTERQQVVLAKHLSFPSLCEHPCNDMDTVGASHPHSVCDGESQQTISAQSTGVNWGDTPGFSASENPQRIGVHETNLEGAAHSAIPLKQQNFKQQRGKHTTKSLSQNKRRSQKLVKEAALMLLDISDRVPFTGVRSSGVKVWTKFDRDTRNALTVKELLRQLRWFESQIKQEIFGAGWMALKKHWVASCSNCDKAIACKALVMQLESHAIDWKAVAMTWAMERGMDVHHWPVSWGSSLSDKTQSPACKAESGVVEKWRACVDVYLGGKFRSLGLTFVLAAPRDLDAAAAGPTDGQWDETEADVDGVQELEGEKDWFPASRLGVYHADDGVVSEAGDWGSDETMMCPTPPRSPFLAAHFSQGTREPIGGGVAIDGMGDEVEVHHHCGARSTFLSAHSSQTTREPIGGGLAVDGMLDAVEVHHHPCSMLGGEADTCQDLGNSDDLTSDLWNTGWP
mmetsp:Transcript_11178/g.22433  ORF Transcript_11178/g.22433 Transcript_11178/m.22433 type:complete len:457 (+) Transcript_11178:262-1632(+)